MKIICDPDVLKSYDDKQTFISCMFAHRESHSVDISNITKIINSGNLKPNEIEIFKKLTVASANRNYTYTVTVSNSISNNGICVGISELNNVLSKKAVIVLENEFSDSNFLDVILLSQHKTKLLRSKNISWEVRGAGGCGEIPKFIESEISKMSNLKRLIVIHDSDKLFPGQPAGKLQNKITNTASANSVICFTLEKREIENYIPDKFISAIDHARKSLMNSFSNLSSTQKDYFDYKIGFRNGKTYKLKTDPSFNGLYENITDSVYDDIKEGFGKNLAELVFNKHCNITKDDLDDRCVRINSEFLNICLAIERIL